MISYTGTGSHPFIRTLFFNWNTVVSLYGSRCPEGRRGGFCDFQNTFLGGRKDVAADELRFRKLLLPGLTDKRYGFCNPQISCLHISVIHQSGVPKCSIFTAGCAGNVLRKPGIYPVPETSGANTFYGFGEVAALWRNRTIIIRNLAFHLSSASCRLFVEAGADGMPGKLGNLLPAGISSNVRKARARPAATGSKSAHDRYI